MKLPLHCLELCSFLSEFMLSDFQFSLTAIFLSQWFLFSQETKQPFSYTTLQQSWAAFPAFWYNLLGKVIDNVRKTANFMPIFSTHLSKSQMTQSAENLVKTKVNCHVTLLLFPYWNEDLKRRNWLADTGDGFHSFIPATPTEVRSTWRGDISKYC